LKRKPGSSAAIDAMKEAFSKYGYDGEWFLRAYDDLEEKSEAKKTKRVRFSLSLRILCNG